MSKSDLLCLITIVVSIAVFSVLCFIPAAHAADSSVGFDSASEAYSGFSDSDVYITLVRSGTNLGRDYVDVEIVYEKSYLQEYMDVTFPDGKRVEFDDDQTTATLHVHINGKARGSNGVLQLQLGLAGTWYMDIDEAKSTYTMNVYYPENTEIQFESATYGGKEGDAVQVVLTRFWHSSDDLQISCYAVINAQGTSTATVDKDYTASLKLGDCGGYYQTEKIVFGPGETRKVVTFNLLNDALTEGTEKIDMEIYCDQVSNANTGTLYKATLSIADKPAEKPSQTPSQTPSQVPSKAPSPLSPPTQAPSQAPSQKPSEVPSQAPSQVPSQVPSNIPSQVPSPTPQVNGTVTPSAGPSASPASGSVPYLLLGVGAVGVLVLIALVAALGLAAGFLIGKVKK